MYVFENMNMCKYENLLLEQGYKFIGGIDEAGRGSLAGPVVAACVILNPNNIPDGIADSKKLTSIVRERLYQKIIESAISTGIGVVGPEVIDGINIYNATKKAMVLAVNDLKTKPDYLLIDAVKLDGLSIPGLSMTKGEDKSVSIAAASIIAKVYRDNLLNDLDKIFPNYGFKRNKGYGTAKHKEALKKYGPSEVHRYSYKPVAEAYRLWRLKS